MARRNTSFSSRSYGFDQDGSSMPRTDIPSLPRPYEVPKSYSRSKALRDLEEKSVKPESEASSPKDEGASDGQNDISKREHAASDVDRPLPYTPGKAPKGKKDGKAKSAVKKRAIAWIVGGTAGGLGVGAGLFGGPAMLIVSITDRMTDGIMNVQQSIMTNHSVRVYKGMLSGSACNAGIDCRFKTMSDRQARKLTEAGYKLYDRNGPVTPNGQRLAVTELEPPENVRVSPGNTNRRLNTGNIADEMRASPTLRNSLHKTYSPKFAGLSDRVFYRVLEKAKIGKRSNLPPGGTDEDMRESLKSVVNDGESGGSVKNYHKEQAVDPETGDPIDGQYNLVDSEGTIIVTDTEDIIDDRIKVANSVVDELSDNLDPSQRSVMRAAAGAAENGLQKAASFFSLSGGVLNYVCGIYNAIRAVDIGIKTVRNIQLIRFAMQFMATGDAIKNGTATPEQVNYLGNNLTTVLRSTVDQNVLLPDGDPDTPDPIATDPNTGEPIQIKKGDIVQGAATDSVGMKYVLDGDRLATTPSIQNFIGNGGIWGDIARTIRNISVAGVDIGSIVNQCKTFRSLSFQIADFAVGLVVNVAITIVTFGFGTAGKQAAAAGVRVAIKEGFKAVVDNVFKKMLGRQAIGRMLKSPRFWMSTILEGGFEAALAILPSYLTDIGAGKVIDDDTVGEQSGDAWAVGADTMFQESCKTGGCAPLSSEEAVLYANQTRQTMLAYAEEERVDHAWYDASSPYTLVGSFTSTMALQMAGATSSVPIFINKLFGLVGTAFHRFINIPTSQAVEVDANAYDCDDMTFSEVEVGCDYLGLPAFGLTATKSLESTLANMVGQIDEATGEPKEGEAYASFVKDCIERTTPLGERPLEGVDEPDNDGEECVQGNIYHGKDNVWFYNYHIYKRILDSMDEEPNSAGNAVNPSTPGTPPGDVPSGDAQAIAQQILDNPNITWTGGSLDGKKDMESAAQTGNVIACGTYSSGTVGSGKPFSAQFGGLILALTSKYRLQIGVISQYHSCNTSSGYVSQHGLGNAIDINRLTKISDGSTTTFHDYDKNPALATEFITDLNAYAISVGARLQVGQIDCAGFGVPSLSNVVGFTRDACNHLHLNIVP